MRAMSDEEKYKEIAELAAMIVVEDEYHGGAVRRVYIGEEAIERLTQLLYELGHFVDAPQG